MADKPQINFNFDSYKPDVSETFGYVVNGKHRTIPSAAQLKGIEFFEAALGGDAAATMHVMKEAMTAEQMRELREAAPSIAALGEWVKAYLVHGGVGAGNA